MAFWLRNKFYFAISMDQIKFRVVVSISVSQREPTCEIILKSYEENSKFSSKFQILKSVAFDIPDRGDFEFTRDKIAEFFQLCASQCVRNPDRIFLNIQSDTVDITFSARYPDGSVRTNSFTLKQGTINDSDYLEEQILSSSQKSQKLISKLSMQLNTLKNQIPSSLENLNDGLSKMGKTIDSVKQNYNDLSQALSLLQAKSNQNSTDIQNVKTNLTNNIQNVTNQVTIHTEDLAKQTAESQRINNLVINHANLIQVINNAIGNQAQVQQNIFRMNTLFNHNDYFPSSVILTNDHKATLNCFNGNPFQKWKLVYSSRLHGLAGPTFRTKCNGITDTFTIIQSTEDCIFGGYNSVPWKADNAWQGDHKSFLFSLRKRGVEKKLKFPANPANNNQLRNAPTYGPTWGYNHDLTALCDNDPAMNYSNIGSSFVLNGGGAKDVLTGGYNFVVQYIEVYKAVY